MLIHQGDLCQAQCSRLVSLLFAGYICFLRKPPPLVGTSGDVCPRCEGLDSAGGGPSLSVSASLDFTYGSCDPPRQARQRPGVGQVRGFKTGQYTVCFPTVAEWKVKFPFVPGYWNLHFPSRHRR